MSLKGVDMCSRVANVGKMKEQKDKDGCTYAEGRIRIRQLSKGQGDKASQHHTNQ